MVDFIKIQIVTDHQKELLDKLEANGWTTTSIVDRNSGVVIEYPFEAKCQDLKITFKSERYIELSGSLHKFSQGGKNYRDFAFSDLLQVIMFLHESIGLNPFTSRIKHLEFGVNISPPFITSEFLPRVLNYKGTNFNAMPKQKGVSLGIVCEKTQLKIKIYCKKTHYNLETEVMRIELKVFKMQYLKPHGVKLLIDLLNPHTWHDFKKQLSEMFAELIITDDSIDVNELPEKEKEMMIHWSNPKHLEMLIKKNRKVFEQERRKFRKIIQSKSRENQQQKVVTLIREQVNQLLTIDDNTFTKFTDFINLFKNESIYHFYHSINRENWKPDTPQQSFPEISTRVLGTRNTPLKEISKPKEDCKIDKWVTEQASVKKGITGERRSAVTTTIRTPEPLKPFLPENWDKQITELEDYFKSISRTPTFVMLNNHTTITNVACFIESHLAMIKVNNGNHSFAPYLERLIQLKEILSERK